MHNKVQYSYKMQFCYEYSWVWKIRKQMSVKRSENLQQKLIIIQTKQFKTFNKGYLLFMFMLNMKNSSLERSVERFGDF